jgi:hypothetical protein
MLAGVLDVAQQALRMLARRRHAPTVRRDPDQGSTRASFKGVRAGPNGGRGGAGVTVMPRAPRRVPQMCRERTYDQRTLMDVDHSAFLALRHLEDRFWRVVVRSRDSA